jgi:hypothetical protein
VTTRSPNTWGRSVDLVHASDGPGTFEALRNVEAETDWGRC